MKQNLALSVLSIINYPKNQALKETNLSVRAEARTHMNERNDRAVRN